MLLSSLFSILFSCTRLTLTAWNDPRSLSMCRMILLPVHNQRRRWQLRYHDKEFACKFTRTPSEIEPTSTKCTYSSCLVDDIYERHCSWAVNWQWYFYTVDSTIHIIIVTNVTWSDNLNDLVLLLLLSKKWRQATINTYGTARKSVTFSHTEHEHVL